MSNPKNKAIQSQKPSAKAPETGPADPRKALRTKEVSTLYPPTDKKPNAQIKFDLLSRCIIS